MKDCAMKKFSGPIVNALLVGVLVLLFLETASGVPYCLLRAPYDPPQGNCFQFYLADTATLPARVTVAGGVCAVTPLAAREGWEVDLTFPGPLSTWSAGDAAMGVVSPYFGDAYGCHAADGNTGSGNGGNGTGGGQMAPSIPQSLRECETYTSEICGTWTLEGDHFNANWDNGATATIKVEQWDTTGVVLTRYDSTGSSAGLSARYEGQLNGSIIDNGVVTWTWNGNTWSGTWRVDTGTGGNGAVLCPSGQTNCNGACTDVSSDSNNCGYCGNICSSGASCMSGSCSASASPGTGGQSSWDKPFSTPQYLVHATGHGTIDGPRTDDWWFLYPQAPQNGALSLPDGTGGTFTYSIDQSSGPFNSPREVCNAAAGKVGDSSLGAWNSQDSFSCKNMA